MSKTNSARKSCPDIGPQSPLFPTSAILTAAPTPEPICLPEVSHANPSHAPGSVERGARQGPGGAGASCCATGDGAGNMSHWRASVLSKGTSQGSSPKRLAGYFPASLLFIWSWRRELNPRPADYKSTARQSALRTLRVFAHKINPFFRISCSGPRGTFSRAKRPSTSTGTSRDLT